jgi:hypothetical protein
MVIFLLYGGWIAFLVKHFGNRGYETSNNKYRILLWRLNLKRKTTDLAVVFLLANKRVPLNLHLYHMGKIILYIHCIISFVFFLNLFAALSVLKESNKTDYLKGIYWYPLVGSIVGLCFYLNVFGVIPFHVFRVIDIFSLLFQFFFLSVFIYKLTGRKFNFKIVILISSLFVGIQITIDLLQNTNTSFAVTSTILIAFSLYYFYVLFNSLPINQDLTKYPPFLICCGVLLGTGITVPFLLFNRYLMFLNVPKNTIFALGILATTGNLILNLFFLKALLCIRQSKLR